MTDERIRWSGRSLDDLAALYWERIATALEREGRDPTTDRPTYRWLVDHGFGGIQYALREQHDCTVADFLTDVIGLPERGGFDWGIDDASTRAALDAYVDDLENRQGLRETTVRSKRARLARYVRTYADRHGSAYLLSGLGGETEKPAEIERVLDTFDAVGDALSSDASRLQYLGDVRGFYAHLVRRGRAAYTPLADAEAEFPWEREEPDNPALSAEGVRTLYDGAETTAERLLIVGLAGWGLRPSELAALNRAQVSLSTDPHLTFESRKNGPGTVSLIYGLDPLAARMDALDDDEWTGHLFPSDRSSTGHVVADTVRNRFIRLADRAGVRVDGTVPTPKLCRRFWYGAYVDATAAILDHLEEVAADQGSTSPDVVYRNYLPEDRRRALRRRFMRARLRQAFGDAPPDRSPPR